MNESRNVSVLNIHKMPQPLSVYSFMSWYLKNLKKSIEFWYLQRHLRPYGAIELGSFVKAMKVIPCFSTFRINQVSDFEIRELLRSWYRVYVISLPIYFPTYEVSILDNVIKSVHYTFKLEMLALDSSNYYFSFEVKNSHL